jgi:hypothetical protein
MGLYKENTFTSHKFSSDWQLRVSEYLMRKIKKKIPLILLSTIVIHPPRHHICINWNSASHSLRRGDYEDRMIRRVVNESNLDRKWINGRLMQRLSKGKAWESSTACPSAHKIIYKNETSKFVDHWFLYNLDSFLCGECLTTFMFTKFF